MRKVQRREKNRIAAQKSRQRQTQKADTLHLVSAQTSLPPPELQALFPPPVNAWTIALSLPVWGCICGAVNGGVRATGEWGSGGSPGSFQEAERGINEPQAVKE